MSDLYTLILLLSRATERKVGFGIQWQCGRYAQSSRQARLYLGKFVHVSCTHPPPIPPPSSLCFINRNIESPHRRDRGSERPRHQGAKSEASRR